MTYGVGAEPGTEHTAMTPSFPIHLCQPDASKSCAACCGIYNFILNDRFHTVQRLSRNTRALRCADRGRTECLQAHARAFRSPDNGEAKRFETVFNCEYVGFLNEDETLTGCLLHPARHRGRDLRDHSFYGAQLCEGHFCLSYYYLTLAEQQLVVNTLDDWYLYGLVITDIDLVKGYFQAVANRLGESIDPFKAARFPLKQKVRDFFHWKLSWPFSPLKPDRFGKYLFKGESYEEIRIPYGRWHRKPSAHHSVLTALGSEFSTSAELDRAEALIEESVLDFVKAYERE